MSTQITKIGVFNVFYSLQSVTRKGGGTAKNKMTRNNVPLKVINNTQQLIMKSSNPKLLKYFEKLRDRNPKIAPPPSPK